ncbi:transglutaminase family protein, partial [Salmonella enterica]|uniref:transglutaminase family protein n=1 Tax=Salmonella enterica TaxID=28901 RepID=UPI003FA6CDBB
LSLVWSEIARRAGVLARGVGFPGHFLVRVDELPALSGRGPASPIIVDPFNESRIVTDADALRLLERAQGANAELHPAFFEPASARATLVRMLSNLKAVWSARGEHMRVY